MRTDVRILEAQPFYSQEQAREPLKSGNVAVEEALCCRVRVRVESQSGQVADGWGALQASLAASSVS